MHNTFNEKKIKLEVHEWRRFVSVRGVFCNISNTLKSRNELMHFDRITYEQHLVVENHKSQQEFTSGNQLATINE